MERAFEHKLIKQAIDGDSSAFESLILPYEKKVYNIAYQMFKNEQDAYDAAQEVLIKVYRNLDKFNFESGFSTWLHRLAMNTCIDEYRKKKRHRAKTVSMEQKDDGEDRPVMQLVDHKPTPEQQVLQDEQVREVREALGQLKEEQRIMLIYRDLQDMSYKEIAKICDCSLGTVKSRIARARKALKEIIQRNREQIPTGKRL